MSISIILHVFWTFFRMSAIVFGGPAAHLSLFEQELVRRQQWLSAEHFLDIVGASNLIPGPNSTEIAMHCGYIRAGVPGLIAAGLGFILPAALITLGLAWMYMQYGDLPAMEPFMYGIKPAVLGIIVPSVSLLFRKAWKSQLLLWIGLGTLTASILGLGEVVVILGAGVLALVFYQWQHRGAEGVKKSSFLLILPGFSWTFSLGAGSLFAVFFKVGALLFGSGLVLMAYLEDELVRQRGWLTMEQLVEAIAIGQFTPGPILSTATFIGYQLLGFKGALAATAGIFLPSFLYAGLLNRLLRLLKSSASWRVFLDGVNMAAVAVMAAVTLRLTLHFAFDPGFLVLGGISVVLGLFKPGLHPGFLILGGALSGWLWTWVFAA